jgi:hypothetical protein
LPFKAIPMIVAVSLIALVACATQPVVPPTTTPAVAVPANPPPAASTVAPVATSVAAPKATAAAVPTVGAANPAVTPAQPTATQPPSAAPDGAALLNSKCTACHNLDRVKSAKKDASGWKATVDRMIGKGAQLSATEAEGLVKHLADTYK